MKNWNLILNDELKKYIYYIDENNLIFNGDINEVLSKFDANKIDLIVTSPPYNVGIKYLKWKDTLSPEDYFNFVKQFLLNFKKVLKPDGRFAINIPYDTNMKHIGKKFRVSLLGEYYGLLKETGLKYNNIAHLQEDHPHRVKFTAWGSWLSASAPYQYCNLECVLIGYKENWKKLNKGTSTIDKELFKETASGTWKYEAEKKKWTQANFSLDIPYKAIQSLTYLNDIVMDPFMGSGTSGIAAKKSKRKFIGIEISKEYCEIAVNRILNN